MATEITITPTCKISSAEIEKIGAELCLKITLKCSLKSIAENIHWHYQNGTEKGTLEITLLVEK